MKRTWLIRGALLITLLTVLTTGLVLADGLSFTLDWWTLDGGGGTFSTGGDYTLGGTIGQPDAGLLTGSDYTLGGGFWGGGEVHAPAHFVYLAITLR